MKSCKARVLIVPQTQKRTFTFSKCSFFGCGIRIATRFARVHASFSQSAVAKARLLGNYAISPDSGSHPDSRKKRKHLPSVSTFFLAAESGFEPEQSESESLVLPLHYSAMLICNENNYNTRYLLCQ